MATIKIQLSDSSGNIYHFETESSLVKITSDKFTSDNLKDALEELDENTIKKGPLTWGKLKGM